MKIGVLTWTYPPEKSGLSVAAREIAQSLAEAGHDVRVLTFDRTGRAMDGAVTVIGCALAGGALAWLRKLPATGHLVGPWAMARAVRAEHARAPFDVIEGTNWYAPGLFVALDPRLPFVTRNSTPVATSGAGARGVRARTDHAAARAVEALAAARSDMLISNTAAHGAKIAALYGVAEPGPAHHVVGLSLDPVLVAAGERAAYPAGEAPVRLLFVGRAEYRKGYDALGPAIETLAEEAERGAIPEFALTLVGVGEERVAELSAAAQGRVAAFHRAESDHLYALLADTHVVVAPSRYESFGLVYQEAMAFGRPIVACAEDPSARLFVGETGAGLLAERCDAVLLADQLRWVIREPDLRARLHQASRAAAGRFTRATLASETVAAYRAMLSRR
ncbi:glycosyltransferase family 4 protein [Sphingomonas prati]|uniref:Glycosyltransferase involved in cell wall biosynthesis n=1 Tax=Sphingomonas prati TaxID=1843237 RepID=A0A7W9F0C6_9SPHN|nr:glycosyltransferase family 4 protein [Sphingomonas prati]MBB5728237.1 glycosyltransferase involved in cell wall biosynthesis [Sphingomonas prati]GGE75336.1 glycosyl transferase [Sphingomonas prati]